MVMRARLLPLCSRHAPLTLIGRRSSGAPPNFPRPVRTQQFQPLTPPAPSSLPKPAPPKTYTRLRRSTRRAVYLTLATGLVYLIDRQWYASSLTRSARTFGVGIIVALDYKINFRPHPPLAESIEALHRRNAERLSDLLRNNGGLYLKIGQAIAMQSAILPPEFQKMFARMFDDAPQNSWAEVQQVIREDLGGSPEEVFGVSFDGDPARGVMEQTARASASVAQVHWARLADGREVAIKVQKREIAQQVGWDLWAFKVVAYLYTSIFDLPLYSFVPYISGRLLLETDFVNEADNAERMAELVAHDSRLRGRVYVPVVYRDLSSKRIMTAEWIEGVRLWDKETLTAPWRGGRRGSPGCQGAPLDGPSDPTAPARPDGRIKPDRTGWKGKDGKAGLGLSLKEVMTSMVDLFSAQMFLWGWVHCDPHPGNIFIRRLPSGRPELVLLDHGLYIHLEPAFRHQYALFWKSLLTFDNATLATIAKSWGIGNADFFASATLMRPYAGADQNMARQMRHGFGRDRRDGAERSFEAQQRMRANIRDILGDETKWPLELIFLGRNLRIVQGNNQYLGSPVNRIKITGTWASRALVDSPDLSYAQKWTNLGRHLIFTLVMFSSDLLFYTSKLRQWLGWGQGMEDDMERQLKGIAKETLGVELNHGVFDG
ncbi:MAG: hypothetical protein M1838_001188 [Thelocarpon superellum]|nr:MAG: hypothetical protein M1838_001188 [Thelocarpon superellum]